MSDYEKWEKVLTTIKSKPTVLHTRPKKKGKEPVCFSVSAADNGVIVSKAQGHSNSCRIKAPRKPGFTEFARIYPLHLRREQGESVSVEATSCTHNQVYWYSILHYCFSPPCGMTQPQSM